MDNNLALGFRFYPTEEELISFYLCNKLEGTRPDLDQVIPVLDIYSMDPWQLPQFAGEQCRGDPEQWFFFVPRQERDAHGGRTSRTTGSGYWKATGSPSYAYSSGNWIIGVKRSMVFYKGKVPNGTKTEWKMNEYRAILGEASSSFSSCSSRATPNPTLRHEYSVCRVYIGSGSLRAFDRRPTGVTTSNMGMQPVHQVTSSSDQVVMNGGNGEMAAKSHHHRHHHNPPNMKKRSSSSLDTSSYGGGDDAHPPNQNGESTFWEIFYDDLQPLLELENLDWD